MSLRDSEPPCGRRNAATRPWASLAGPENTLKATSAIKSPTSTSSSGIRNSGLSEPKRCIASA